jgi:hypothetical protein
MFGSSDGDSMICIDCTCYGYGDIHTDMVIEGDVWW